MSGLSQDTTPPANHDAALVLAFNTLFWGYVALGIWRLIG